MKQDQSSNPIPPAAAPEEITLTGRSLSAETVEDAARHGVRVSLAPEAWQRIQAGRRIVEEAIDSDTPLYGVTNGLGSRANERLPVEILADFSRNTIRGRSGAMGEPLPDDIVRALMVIRLNTLSLGGAGASRAVVETLLEVVNAGLIPEMPETASIGSSDLCVMAHLGLALIGEGTFLERTSAGATPVRRPARDLLAERDIAPLEPGPKDGLVLCSSSAFTAARGALALVDGLRALETAQMTAAMSMEGYRGNPSPLDPRVGVARPQPGQERAAAGLRRRLEGSRLFRKDGPRRLQDPLSFRCLAPTHGAAFTAFEFLRAPLDAELNGAGENPLVLVDDHTALSTGNFQMPLLTVALDAAGQALAHVAVGAIGRCCRLLSGQYAGLPVSLSKHWPDGSGFAPLIKTADALLAQIRHDAAATPAELSAGASGLEDTMANAPFAAKKLQRLIGHLEQLLAIEAAIAAQAIDLAGVRHTLPPTVASAYSAVRELVPVLDRDRPLGPELREVHARLVARGTLASF